MSEKITFPCFRDEAGNTFVFPTVYTRETVETVPLDQLDAFCNTYSMLLDVDRIDDFVAEMDENELMKITYVLADMTSPFFSGPIEVYMIAGPLFDATPGE